MESNEGSRDEELQWLLAELADEAHFEARFADAQQRFTRIVVDSADDDAVIGAGAAPAFDDPEMLALLLELDPSLGDRLDPPAE